MRNAMYNMLNELVKIDKLKESILLNLKNRKNSHNEANELCEKLISLF